MRVRKDQKKTAHTFSFSDKRTHIILIIFIVEVTIIEIIHIFVLKGFSSEEIDGTRNDAILEVFSDLVVELETFVESGASERRRRK